MPSKASKKTLDILDILPAAAARRVDELGYAFLGEHGYDVKDADKDRKVRDAIKHKLRERGETLQYTGAIDDKTGNILVWFNLYRGKVKIATSVAIKFIQKDGDKLDGEGDADPPGSEES